MPAACGSTPIVPPRRSISRLQIARPRPEPGTRRSPGTRRHGSKTRAVSCSCSGVPPLMTASRQPSPSGVASISIRPPWRGPYLIALLIRLWKTTDSSLGSACTTGSAATSATVLRSSIMRSQVVEHLRGDLRGVDRLELDPAVRAGIEEQRVDHLAGARGTAADRVQPGPQLGIEVVAEVLGDHDRAALGDDQRLGELMRRGRREALHRAAVLAQVVDLRLEVVDTLAKPRGLCARGREGVILGGAPVADGRDEVRAGTCQQGPVHDAVGDRVGVHAQIDVDPLARRQRVLDRHTHRGVVERADRHPPVRANQAARLAAEQRLPGPFHVGEAALGVDAEPQLARAGGEGRVARLGEGEGADASSVVLGEVRHRPGHCFRHPHSHRSWWRGLPLGAIRSLSVRVFEPWPPAHPTVAGRTIRRK